MSGGTGGGVAWSAWAGGDCDTVKATASAARHIMSRRRGANGGVSASLCFTSGSFSSPICGPLFTREPKTYGGWIVGIPGSCQSAGDQLAWSVVKRRRKRRRRDVSRSRSSKTHETDANPRVPRLLPSRHRIRRNGGRDVTERRRRAVRSRRRAACPGGSVGRLALGPTPPGTGALHCAPWIHQRFPQFRVATPRRRTQKNREI